MHIGVDFDNTIICYDSLFHAVAREMNLIHEMVAADKASVRDHLIKIDKEEDWTRLQGLVYGKRINAAIPYPGVIDFFNFCKQNDISVSIISHKTRHPYLGPTYDLHKSAYGWLKQNRFLCVPDPLVPVDHVYFEKTKIGKINRILESGCTHFIDDLPEFLLEPSFPSDVTRVLFDPNENHVPPSKCVYTVSWDQIRYKISSECFRKHTL